MTADRIILMQPLIYMPFERPVCVFWDYSWAWNLSLRNEMSVSSKPCSFNFPNPPAFFASLMRIRSSLSFSCLSRFPALRAARSTFSTDSIMARSQALTSSPGPSATLLWFILITAQTRIAAPRNCPIDIIFPLSTKSSTIAVAGNASS